MSNTLKEASGWPHSFHKKIPGLFKENHSFFKNNFKGQKINNQQKYLLNTKSGECTINNKKKVCNIYMQVTIMLS